jgi:hypothetical protein
MFPHIIVFGSSNAGAARGCRMRAFMHVSNAINLSQITLNLLVFVLNLKLGHSLKLLNVSLSNFEILLKCHDLMSRTLAIRVEVLARLAELGLELCNQRFNLDFYLLLEMLLFLLNRPSTLSE